MTNEGAPIPAPAGWYPSPDGSPQHRWWTGTAWTEHAGAAAPYTGVAPSVPSSTPTSTLWVWLTVAVPAVAMLPIFGWDVGAYMVASATDPVASVLSLFDPWYVTTLVLGWAAYGLAVWFAYLDHAELGRLGYRRRVHWAWAFLYSVGYVIARCVVVRRQAGGRGAAPMWVAITLTVVSTLVLFIWMTAAVVLAMPEVLEYTRSTYPASPS
jgi:hypothetical protein